MNFQALICAIFQFTVIYASNNWLDAQASIKFKEPERTIVNDIDEVIKNIIIAGGIMNSTKEIFNHIAVVNLSKIIIDKNIQLSLEVHEELNGLVANFSNVNLYKCREAGYNEYLKIINIHDFVNECSTVTVPKIIIKFEQYETLLQKYLATLDEEKKVHSCSIIERVYKIDCTNSSMAEMTRSMIRVIEHRLQNVIDFTKEINIYTMDPIRVCNPTKLYDEYLNKVKSCLVSKKNSA